MLQKLTINLIPVQIMGFRVCFAPLVWIHLSPISSGCKGDGGHHPRLHEYIYNRLQAFWQSALSRRFPHRPGAHTHKKAFLHMSVSFSQAFVFQKLKKYLALSLSPARRTLAGFLMNNTSTGRNRHIVPAGVHWKKTPLWHTVKRSTCCSF